MNCYTDSDVEQLHKTVADEREASVKYRQALVAILDACEHEAPGYWRIATLGGGMAYCDRALGDALTSALRAVIGQR